MHGTLAAGVVLAGVYTLIVSVMVRRIYGEVPLAAHIATFGLAVLWCWFVAWNVSRAWRHLMQIIRR